MALNDRLIAFLSLHLVSLMQLLPNSSAISPQTLVIFCIFEEEITSDKLYVSTLRFCRQQVQLLHWLLA